jgi:acetyl-CoA carboxylase biotin carboxyl carrier protein
LNVLEHEDVEEILKLLDATPVREFELETERFKIILRRGAGGNWTQECETHRATDLVAGGNDAADKNAAGKNASGSEALGRVDTGKAPVAKAAATALDAAAANIEGAADTREIRAPLVGTFYRSPKPGAPPFVETGSVVGVESVVAIVETMKLMTSIYAGHSGRIAEILIDDGQFVAQNQLLMRVAPSAL